MKGFSSESERKQFGHDIDELMAIVNSGRGIEDSKDFLLEEIIGKGHGNPVSGHNRQHPISESTVGSKSKQHVPGRKKESRQVNYKIKRKKVKSLKEIVISPGWLKKALIILLAGIGTVTISAAIANHISKNAGVKGGDTSEPPESSITNEIGTEESSKEESSKEETSQKESSKEETGIEEPSKSQKGTIFSKNFEAVKACKEYRNNWFGEYIVETAETYGVDPNIALAQLKHESFGFRHETVLPSRFIDQGYAIPGDDGENFFNGTGYGLGQITVPEDAQVLKAVNIINGHQDEILINEDNAVNPFTNMQIYAMLNQDNQDRLLAVIIDKYNEAIGQENCFNINNIREILSGKHLGLPFDDQRAAKEIMNAVFNANIQCYNYGLRVTLDCVEFSSDGYFLEGKFTEKVREEHDSRDDFGDPNYRQHVLEGVSTDTVTNYVYELSGYVTYDITKPANEMFESYTYSPAPVQISWNYDSSNGQKVNS